MQVKELSENDVNAILDSIVAEDMAKQGLKVISYGFKEIALNDLS